MFSNNVSTHATKTGGNLLAAVYGWMATALMLSAISAYVTLSSYSFFVFVHQNPLLFFGLLLLQVGLVISLSAMLPKLSFPAALGIFLIYAITMGITLSSIFILYTAASIGTTFLTASAMFGFMAAYGQYTKSDLSNMGNILLMLLFGLIISTIVNIFFQNEVFDLALSAIGIVIFTLLTAYDAQRIKLFMQQQGADTDADQALINKTTILAALMLYLDFINLFMYLLRFMGKQRKD
jgi:FtsH-binding integral membrane protein